MKPITNPMLVPYSKSFIESPTSPVFQEQPIRMSGMVPGDSIKLHFPFRSINQSKSLNNIFTRWMNAGDESIYESLEKANLDPESISASQNFFSILKAINPAYELNEELYPFDADTESFEDDSENFEYEYASVTDLVNQFGLKPQKARLLISIYESYNSYDIETPPDLRDRLTCIETVLNFPTFGDPDDTKYLNSLLTIVDQMIDDVKNSKTRQSILSNASPHHKIWMGIEILLFDLADIRRTILDEIHKLNN